MQCSSSRRPPALAAASHPVGPSGALPPCTSHPGCPSHLVQVSTLHFPASTGCSPKARHLAAPAGVRHQPHPVAKGQPSTTLTASQRPDPSEPAPLKASETAAELAVGPSPRLRPGRVVQLKAPVTLPSSPRMPVRFVVSYVVVSDGLFNLVLEGRREGSGASLNMPLPLPVFPGAGQHPAWWWNVQDGSGVGSSGGTGDGMTSPGRTWGPGGGTDSTGVLSGVHRGLSLTTEPWSLTLAGPGEELVGLPGLGPEIAAEVANVGGKNPQGVEPKETSLVTETSSVVAPEGPGLERGLADRKCHVPAAAASGPPQSAAEHAAGPAPSQPSSAAASEAGPPAPTPAPGVTAAAAADAAVATTAATPGGCTGSAPGTEASPVAAKWRFPLASPSAALLALQKPPAVPGTKTCSQGNPTSTSTGQDRHPAPLSPQMSTTMKPEAAETRARGPPGQPAPGPSRRPDPQRLPPASSASGPVASLGPGPASGGPNDGQGPRRSPARSSPGRGPAALQHFAANLTSASGRSLQARDSLPSLPAHAVAGDRAAAARDPAAPPLLPRPRNPSAARMLLSTFKPTTLVRRSDTLLLSTGQSSALQSPQLLPPPQVPPLAGRRSSRPAAATTPSTPEPALAEATPSFPPGIQLPLNDDVPLAPLLRLLRTGGLPPGLRPPGSAAPHVARGSGSGTRTEARTGASGSAGSPASHAAALRLRLQRGGKDAAQPLPAFSPALVISRAGAKSVRPVQGAPSASASGGQASGEGGGGAVAMGQARWEPLLSPEAGAEGVGGSRVMAAGGASTPGGGGSALELGGLVPEEWLRVLRTANPGEVLRRLASAATWGRRRRSGRRGDRTAAGHEDGGALRGRRGRDPRGGAVDKPDPSSVGAQARQGKTVEGWASATAASRAKLAARVPGVLQLAAGDVTVAAAAGSRALAVSAAPQAPEPVGAIAGRLRPRAVSAATPTNPGRTPAPAAPAAPPAPPPSPLAALLAAPPSLTSVALLFETHLHSMGPEDLAAGCRAVVSLVQAAANGPAGRPPAWCGAAAPNLALQQTVLEHRAAVTAARTATGSFAGQKGAEEDLEDFEAVVSAGRRLVGRLARRVAAVVAEAEATAAAGMARRPLDLAAPPAAAAAVVDASLAVLWAYGHLAEAQDALDPQLAVLAGRPASHLQHRAPVPLEAMASEPLEAVAAELLVDALRSPAERQEATADNTAAPAQAQATEQEGRRPQSSSRSGAGLLRPQKRGGAGHRRRPSAAAAASANTSSPPAGTFGDVLMQLWRVVLRGCTTQQQLQTDLARRTSRDVRAGQSSAREKARAATSAAVAPRVQRWTSWAIWAAARGAPSLLPVVLAAAAQVQAQAPQQPGLLRGGAAESSGRLAASGAGHGSAVESEATGGGVVEGCWPGLRSLSPRGLVSILWGCGRYAEWRSSFNPHTGKRRHDAGGSGPGGWLPGWLAACSPPSSSSAAEPEPGSRVVSAVAAGALQLLVEQVAVSAAPPYTDAASQPYNPGTAAVRTDPSHRSGSMDLGGGRDAAHAPISRARQQSPPLTTFDLRAALEGAAAAFGGGAAVDDEVQSLLRALLAHSSARLHDVIFALDLVHSWAAPSPPPSPLPSCPRPARPSPSTSASLPTSAQRSPPSMPSPPQPQLPSRTRDALLLEIQLAVLRILGGLPADTAVQLLCRPRLGRPGIHREYRKAVRQGLVRPGMWGRPGLQPGLLLQQSDTVDAAEVEGEAGPSRRWAAVRRLRRRVGPRGGHLPSFRLRLRHNWDFLEARVEGTGARGGCGTAATQGAVSVGTGPGPVPAAGRGAGAGGVSGRGPTSLQIQLRDQQSLYDDPRVNCYGTADLLGLLVALAGPRAGTVRPSSPEDAGTGDGPLQNLSARAMPSRLGYLAPVPRPATVRCVLNALALRWVRSGASSVDVTRMIGALRLLGWMPRFCVSTFTTAWRPFVVLTPGSFSDAAVAGIAQVLGRLIGHNGARRRGRVSKWGPPRPSSVPMPNLHPAPGLPWPKIRVFWTNLVCLVTSRVKAGGVSIAPPPSSSSSTRQSATPPGTAATPPALMPPPPVRLPVPLRPPTAASAAAGAAAAAGPALTLLGPVRTGGPRVSPTAQLPPMSCASLVRMAWSGSRQGARTPEFMALACAVLLPALPRLPPAEVGSLAWALGQSLYVDARMNGGLLVMLRQWLALEESGTGQQCHWTAACRVAWALVRMRVLAPTAPELQELLGQLGRRLRPREDPLSPSARAGSGSLHGLDAAGSRAAAWLGANAIWAAALRDAGSPENTALMDPSLRGPGYWRHMKRQKKARALEVKTGKKRPRPAPLVNPRALTALLWAIYEAGSGPGGEMDVGVGGAAARAGGPGVGPAGVMGSDTRLGLLDLHPMLFRDVSPFLGQHVYDLAPQGLLQLLQIMACNSSPARLRCPVLLEGFGRAVQRRPRWLLRSVGQVQWVLQCFRRLGWWPLAQVEELAARAEELRLLLPHDFGLLMLEKQGREVGAGFGGRGFEAGR